MRTELCLGFASRMFHKLTWERLGSPVPGTVRDRGGTFKRKFDHWRMLVSYLASWIHVGSNFVLPPAPDSLCVVV